MTNTLSNMSFRDADLELWTRYSKFKSPENRSALLQRMEGVIQAQVNKWAGPISRDILTAEAKLLAIKAFDSYHPNAGTSLATHVTNGLLPLSRLVYTYKDTARLPENLASKTHTFYTAQENLKALYGREPTTDELHDSLGWTASEINRIRNYSHDELVESGPTVSGDFFAEGDTSEDDMILGSLYMSLMPDEKRLFEVMTGYNGARKLNNDDQLRTLNMTQSQLSYKKILLRKKIDAFLKRPGFRRKYGR